ncbi:hypothetical protein KI387_000702, partial [Taxus chinensis]
KCELRGRRVIRPKLEQHDESVGTPWDKNFQTGHDEMGQLGISAGRGNVPPHFCTWTVGTKSSDRPENHTKTTKNDFLIVTTRHSVEILKTIKILKFTLIRRALDYLTPPWPTSWLFLGHDGMNSWNEKGKEIRTT